MINQIKMINTIFVIGTKASLCYAIFKFSQTNFGDENKWQDFVYFQIISVKLLGAEETNISTPKSSHHYCVCHWELLLLPACMAIWGLWPVLDLVCWCWMTYHSTKVSMLFLELLYVLHHHPSNIILHLPHSQWEYIKFRLRRLIIVNVSEVI